MTNEELKARIGANIARLRKQKRMTQAELAERLNYSDKAVSKWGRAESMPDVLTLMQLAEQAAKAQRKPKLYIACGTEDFLIGENREFCAHVKALGFDAVCEEWPGIHDWAFWDRACGRSLAYMAGLKPEEVNC